MTALRAGLLARMASYDNEGRIIDPLRAGMESGALLPMAGDLLMPPCENCSGATDGKHGVDCGGGIVPLCVRCAGSLCACAGFVLTGEQPVVWELGTMHASSACGRPAPLGEQSLTRRANGCPCSLCELERGLAL